MEKNIKLSLRMCVAHARKARAHYKRFSINARSTKINFLPFLDFNLKVTW